MQPSQQYRDAGSGGGIMTDWDLMSNVEGLYAAGEVANSNFYGTIYTCGTAFGHAVIYGRIAGASAAANLK